MIRKEFLYLGWYFLLCIPIIIVYIRFSAKAKREWLILIGQIKSEATEAEKREYIRLDSTFPIEFQKVEGDQEFEIHQGYTKDISKNGMCISGVTVRGRKLEDLVPDQTKLRLIINIPLESHAIIALATVRWIRKTEDIAVDRYSIGVSYDDIAEPDLSRIIKYALGFRRKPNILAVMTVIVVMVIAAFFSTIIIFRDVRSHLEARLEAVGEDRTRLAKEVEVLEGEKEDLIDELEMISQKYTALWERLREMEKKRYYKKTEVVKKEPEKAEEVVEEEKEEEVISEPEEVKEWVEDILEEPVVELRKPVLPEDEIAFEPNITKKMIESEKGVYKTFRDYILKEEIQLLDRYCSAHRTSIYHASGLFALAELRYKTRHIKEMTIKAYRDVIRLYPKSKHASYASHRLDQITRNLPYEAYSLKYYSVEYNLPPLYDYRELEPYKE